MGSSPSCFRSLFFVSYHMNDVHAIAGGGEAGKKINVERQAVLAEIAEAERRALDVEALPIDVTAWSGVNEGMP